MVTLSLGGETVRAFVPATLPPVPPLEIDGVLRDRLDAALLDLGRLDAVSTILPDRSLFLYMYVRKEAVLSSQIEGTQFSLSDLLLFEAAEAPGVPVDDVTARSSSGCAPRCSPRSASQTLARKSSPGYIPPRAAVSPI